MPPVNSFVTVSSLALGLFLGCLAHGDPTDVGTVFAEKTRYVSGRAMSMERRNGKLNFEVHLAFLGARCFSLTTPETAKKASDLEELPPKELFGTGEYDFRKIPAAMAIFKKMITGIEQHYATDFSSLKLVPHFYDERTLLDPDLGDEPDECRAGGGFLGNIYDSTHPFRGKKPIQDAIRVKILTDLSPWRTGQTAWDLYGKPWIFAHELGHLMGNLFEGYGFSDYPPNGIMNDELAWTVLKDLAPAVEIKVTREDINQILFGPSGDVATMWRPKVTLPPGFVAATSENSFSKDKTPGRNYLAVPFEEKLKIQTELVKAWIKQQRK